MGYPENFKAVLRQVADNVVTASTQFVGLRMNLGARMALIKNDHGIVVWSAIPYGKEAIRALELLTGREESPDKPFEVKYLIIPNKQHTEAAKSFKEQYPNMKIVASDKVSVEGLKIDHLISQENSNKILDKTSLEQIGITDPVVSENIQFVYLQNNPSGELVTFDKKSRILFSSDLLFNLGVPGSTNGGTVLEQYSKESEFEGTNPHSGWSYPTRFLQPESKIGKWMVNMLVKPQNDKEGFKAIANWDFQKIVLSHGNLIEENSKDVFKSVYDLVFSKS